MTIESKVVVITGASSGIGRAVARLLAERGGRVVLGARRESALAVVAEEIAAAGGQAACRATDVTRLSDVRALIALAVDRFGRIDALVNVAGIGPISRFDALRMEDWDAMIDVNLRGTLHGIGAALPLFKAQQSGHIVNVVSTAGLKILPTMGVYAATKNAVRTATEALRQESRYIRVTEVSPGYVATDFSRSIKDPEVLAQVSRRKDAFAIAPEAVARAIAYAMEEPDDVEIGSIVVRPTAQD